MIENIATISSLIFKIALIVSVILLFPKIVFAFMGFGKKITYHPKS